MFEAVWRGTMEKAMNGINIENSRIAVKRNITQVHYWCCTDKKQWNEGIKT